MKILITGVAGFVGFHVAKKLLGKHHVMGLDNINNYYSTTLKKQRILILKKFKKFSFIKMDIQNENKLKLLLKKNQYDYVIHLAAQVGVRYCQTNPKKYIDTNILGFFNLLNNLRYTKLKKIIYASSSSVYGDKKKFPIKESDNLNPKNIYGLSKKFNEELASLFLHKTQLVGLRFFTVYGEWGRPDMFFLKILKSIVNKKKFFLHNNGNHYRDFTYINDVVNLICKLLNSKIKARHEIFNICSSKPVLIKNLVSKIEKIFGRSKKYKLPLNKLEMIKTHGSNQKISKLLNYKEYKSIDYGLKKTIDWFQAYNKKIKF